MKVRKIAYRNFVIQSYSQLTCAGGGDSYSVAVANIGGVRKISRTVPNYRSNEVVKKIGLKLKRSKVVAENLFKDLVAFLWISGQTPEVSIPSPAIDEAWHVFLLFTREYNDFCNKYCGGFIHHEPNSDSTALPSLSLVKPTIDRVCGIFGKKPNANWDYVPFKR